MRKRTVVGLSLNTDQITLVRKMAEEYGISFSSLAGLLIELGLATFAQKLESGKGDDDAV